MNKSEQYSLGMSAYNAGRYREAIDCLAPLLSLRRGPQALLSKFYIGQAHYRLAVELFNDRQYKEALYHFRSAAHANPHGGDFGRFLAACYLGNQQYELAAAELQTLLRRDPRDPGLRIRLALTQWKQGNRVEAVSILREGVRLNPDNAEVHYQLGVMLASEEELSEAEKLLERAISLNPSHAGAYERLAQCCSVNNRHERALLYLEHAHQLDSSNTRVAWQLALISQSMAEAQRPAIGIRKQPLSRPLEKAAIDRLGDAIAAEPDFVQAFLSLPVTEVDGEVFSTLAATLESALRKHPEFADLHYHCGMIYRRLGRDKDAIQHAEQAVQLNPRYVGALILLAQLYGLTDRCAAAMERLEQAIHAGGDYPDVHCLMGQISQTAGEFARARQAYQRALDLNKDYSAAKEALAALPF